MIKARYYYMVKRALMAIFTCLYINTACSQILTLREDHFLLNDTRFDSLNVIEDYFKVLGKPSRSSHLTNNIYVYDELGLYLYEDHKNCNKVVQISFDLRKNREFHFSPKRPYVGNLFLDGCNLDLAEMISFDRLKNICNAKGNFTYEIDKENSCVDFYHGRFHLFIDFNSTLTKVYRVNIAFNHTTIL